jgi:hypothetical protein
MRDLASLTPADFESAVGSVFEITGGESGPVRVRLAEVAVLGERPGHRQPFALRFHGPASPVLTQAIHGISHAGIGELELFLGPVVSDSDGITYEAIFA